MKLIINKENNKLIDIGYEINELAYFTKNKVLSEQKIFLSETVEGNEDDWSDSDVLEYLTINKYLFHITGELIPLFHNTVFDTNHYQLTDNNAINVIIVEQENPNHSLYNVTIESPVTLPNQHIQNITLQEVCDSLRTEHFSMMIIKPLYEAKS